MAKQDQAKPIQWKGHDKIEESQEGLFKRSLKALLTDQELIVMK